MDKINTVSFNSTHTMSKLNKLDEQKICCFCGLAEDNELEFGKFYEDSGIVTHYYCLLLSSNMEQRGNDNEGILGFLTMDIHKEIKRGKRLICSYCKRNGATLGCCNTKCKKIFHFPCGLRAGSLNQFFGEFRSYCISHRPKQKIDDSVKKQLKETEEDILCYICYDTVKPHDFVNTLWAPCCRKNAWFHRICVQQLAMSAGYFFKCPLCNNQKKFQKAMKEYGIFIPSQDASWELVPNAFQELLYRHDQCDAPICLCPKGRKHTSSNAKWELALCRSCGSQGIHMACGQLKWANPVWECSECSSILRKSKDVVQSGTTTNIVHENDSEDSDTDISVGKDSPISFESSPRPYSIIASPIKLRPGPQSYKLQQLMANKVMMKGMRQNGAHLSNATNSTFDSIHLKKGAWYDETSTSKSNSGVKTGNTKGAKSRFNQYSDSVPTICENDVIMIDSEDDVEIISHESAEHTLSNNVSPNCEMYVSSQTPEDENVNMTNSNSVQTNISNQPNLNDSVSKPFILPASILRKRSSIFPRGTMNDRDSNHTTHSDQEFDYTDGIPAMNIKITDVTSLSPDMFAKANAMDENNTVPLELNGDIEILDTDQTTFTSPRSTSSPQDNTESSLKRKYENAYSHGKSKLTSPTRMIEKCKKTKGDTSGQHVSSSTDAMSDWDDPICTTSETVTSSTSNTTSNLVEVTKEIVNSVVTKSKKVKITDFMRPLHGCKSDSDSDRKDVNINRNKTYSRARIPCNDNKICITGNVDTVHNQSSQAHKTNDVTFSEDLHKSVPIVTEIVSDENMTLPVTGCVQDFNESTNKNDNNQIAILSENDCSVANNIDQSLDGISNEIHPTATDCNGDAGISPAVERGNGCPVKDACWSKKAAVSPRTDNTTWNASDTNTAEQNIPSTSCNSDTHGSIFSRVTNDRDTCDRTRLIPEYVRLQDLKFRVRDLDKLQMVLYDTFSVNVDVDTTLKGKKMFDGTEWKNTQGKFSEAQCEPSTAVDYKHTLQNFEHVNNVPDNLRNITSISVEVELY